MSVTTKINGFNVTFEAVLDFQGRPSLKATHVEGKEVDCGYIVAVTDEGKLFREPSVNTTFPLILNKSGMVKIDKVA